MKVVEIFDSIQGEGYYMGYQCTFIRLAGCNLACDFCDEALKYKDAKNMDILDILKQINHKHVVITGGEPTLQPIFEDMAILLMERGHIVHVETNGTNPINISKEHFWVTVSPKGPKYVCNCAFDEMKLVVDDKLTIDTVRTLHALSSTKVPIWLQPCDGPYIEESKRKIIQWCKEYPDMCRAGIQLHKWYNER